jgi:hypothetical protein
MKSRSFAWFFLFALIFSIQVIPRFWGDSLTNDEPMEIANGYFYLIHGDVVSHAKHPPLSKALEALPLLVLDLKEPEGAADAMNRAYAFFFSDNLGRLQAMTFWGRLPSFLLGLGIGFLLFIISRNQSFPVLLSAMGLWSFDPTLSAFSGFAMADVPVAFFFLASVLAFVKFQENGFLKFYLLTGVLSGMAVTCKFSALVLLPVFSILEITSWMKKKPNPKKPDLQNPREIMIHWFSGLAGFGLWIFLLYLPGTLRLPDHLSPFHYFWDGFLEMAGYKGHPVYFMGEVGRVNHWAYFPTAFLLKNPLPFLVLLGAGFVLMALRRISCPPWQWVPGIVFLAAILPTQDLGIRYLLPAYPFFILVAAQAAGWVWGKAGKNPLWRAGLVALAFYQVVSVGLNFPHAVSYFNELVPPESKFFWLGDSNLDISQDLRRLGQTAKQRNWGKVKLAYLGGVDPSAYGLSWEPWREEDLKGPQIGNVYAVNASFFQLAPGLYPETLPIATGWMSEAIPSGKINDTWYYFEVPGQRGRDEGNFLPSVPFQQNRGLAPLNPRR